MQSQNQERSASYRYLIPGDVKNSIAEIVDHYWEDALSKSDVEPIQGSLFAHFVSIRNWLTGRADRVESFINKTKQKQN